MFVESLTNQIQFLKKIWGLPWWYRGYESACQCRGHGFSLWFGKIPRATEQPSHVPQVLSWCSRAGELQLPSPWATSTEAFTLEPVPHSRGSHCNKKPQPGKSPCAAAKTYPTKGPTQPKINTWIKLQKRSQGRAQPPCIFPHYNNLLSLAVLCWEVFKQPVWSKGKKKNLHFEHLMISIIRMFSACQF